MTEHRMTNAMKLRLMTDDELAEYTNNRGWCPPVKCDYNDVPKQEVCKKCWLDWLEQEAT